MLKKLLTFFLILFIPACTFAGRLDLFTMQDLPASIRTLNKRNTPSRNFSLNHIGSNNAYAGESKEVQVLGRSATMTIAAVAAFQPMGIFAIAGFALISLYNAKILYDTIKSKNIRKSEWDLVFSQN